MKKTFTFVITTVGIDMGSGITIKLIPMKKTIWACCWVGLCQFSLWAQTVNHDLEPVHRSKRPDGRDQSTYAIVHGMLQQTTPQYAYRTGMSRKEFKQWQRGVSQAMYHLMQFPEVQNQPAPQCVSSEPREGYTLEKWEFYPFPKAVATFLVLKPDKMKGTVPAVLCIPGSGRTKEGLAGEPGVSPRFTEDCQNPQVCMALDMVKEGYVAVAVDNAAAGEMSDLEALKQGRNYDYNVVSRFLLEMGWHWLGYTSYLDWQVLQWMKQQPFIRQDRIVVSGFSLGTEPLMVLGVLDPDIYAFVYNDFLCQTQERALVLTKPNDQLRRPFPNSIRHLVPNYWKYFNFPDVVASLAPRPILFTEGGMDRDFRVVRSAYRDSGKPGHATCLHYAKYTDPVCRKDVEKLPEGLDAAAFFEAANVDTHNHYFKYELVIPWLKEVLGE